ncbi:MAG: Heat shock 105kDa 110kDa protein 1 [Paramarteilia canceri]
MPVLGIDLGSSKVQLSTISGGKVVVVTDEKGAQDIKPAVLFKNGQRIFGNKIGHSGIGNLANYIKHDKISFGNDSSQDRDVFSKEITIKYDKKTGSFIGKHLNADIILNSINTITYFLSYCHKLAKQNINTVCNFDCAITVPYFYTMMQRTHLIKGALAAGFAEVNLINDLTALCFNYTMFNSVPKTDQDLINVVFVEIGYASTQIGLYELNKGKIVEKMSDFILIGAKHVDMKLANEIFKQNEDEVEIDFTDSTFRGLYSSLMMALENYKKILYSDSDVPLHVEYRDYSLDASISGKKFLEIIAEEIEKLGSFLNNFAAKAFKKVSKIQAIIPSGGMIGNLKIQELLSSAFDSKLSMAINSRESGSSGACLLSALKSQTVSINSNLKFFNYFQNNIHISWKFESDEPKDYVTKMLFSAGDSYPSEKIVSISFKESDCNISLFMENKNCPKLDLMNFSINGISCSKNKPKIVKLQFKISQSGILEFVGGYYEVEKKIKYTEEITDDEQEPEDVKVEKQNGNSMNSNGQNSTKIESDKDVKENANNNLEEEDNREERTDNNQNDDKKEGENDSKSNEDKKEKPKQKKKKTITKEKTEKIRNQVSPEFNYCFYDELDVDELKNSEKKRIYENKSHLMDLIQQSLGLLQGPDCEFIDDIEAYKVALEDARSLESIVGYRMDEEKLSKALDSLVSVHSKAEFMINEFNRRNISIDEFQKSLDYVQSFINTVKSQRQDFVQIMDEELNELEKNLQSNFVWLNNSITALSSIPKSADPPILASQFVQKRKELLDSSMPLITRPPPPEPQVEQSNQMDQKSAPNNTDVPQDENKDKPEKPAVDE